MSSRKLSAYESYEHALQAAGGCFIRYVYSYATGEHLIESAVGLLPIVGHGYSYEEAIECSRALLDQHASLWEVAA